MTAMAPCIADAAVRFGGDVLDGEVRLLSAGWHDPLTLHDAAVEYDLSGDSFADATHAAIFTALMALAVENVEPTLELVRALAERNGAHLPDAGYPSDLENIKALEVSSAGIAGFSQAVAANAVKVREARDLQRQLAELIGADGAAVLTGQRTAEPTNARPIIAVETPHTDVGNAERLIARHGQDLHYCEPWAMWLAWDGKRWIRDATGEISRRWIETVRDMYQRAAVIESADARKAAVDYARRCESTAKITAAIHEAKALAGVSVLPEQFDRDGWLLNVQNGTVDLRTGKLRPASRADLITKLAPVQFDPDAKAPRFERFLNEIMGGNPDLIGFLQQLFGLCLTGDVSEHVLPILWGAGANGKSTLIDTIIGMLGDYAGLMMPGLLLAHRGERHPTELADLRGMRLAVSSETEDGRRLQTDLVKSLTGDATIKARVIRGDPFEFPRTHKMILVTNHRPRIRDTSLAIWRRIRLVPFEVTIPPEAQDRHLLETLRGEWPGILRWAVEGCLAWQKAGGLIEPAEVMAATDHYRQDEDPVGEFLAECCMANGDDGQSVSRGAVWAAYEAWADSAGEKHPLSRRGLYERLKEVEGVQERWARERGLPTRVFVGLSLVADARSV